MKKSLFASAALIALIAGGPAMAAETGIVASAPAYAPVDDWTGFYLGGHAGYGWGHDPFNELLVGNIAGLAGFSTSTTPAAPLNDISSNFGAWAVPAGTAPGHHSDDAPRPAHPEVHGRARAGACDSGASR
jgi:opacity protein-like surface antigen